MIVLFVIAQVVIMLFMIGSPAAVLPMIAGGTTVLFMVVLLSITLLVTMLFMVAPPSTVLSTAPPFMIVLFPGAPATNPVVPHAGDDGLDCGGLDQRARQPRRRLDAQGTWRDVSRLTSPRWGSIWPRLALHTYAPFDLVWPSARTPHSTSPGPPHVRPIRFRLAPRTYAPFDFAWPPARAPHSISPGLPHVRPIRCRLAPRTCAPFDAAWPPARAPHGAHVWCLTTGQNENKYPPANIHRSCSRAGPHGAAARPHAPRHPLRRWYAS